jgi:ribokinase
MDIVVETSRFPRSGETIFGTDIHFIPGGKGANQAVAASRLGAITTMLGAVGNDSFGQTLLDSLEGNKVCIDHVKVLENAPTGVASITLSPNENQIVVIPGANGSFGSEDVAAGESMFAESDFIVLQLEIPMETVIYAAEMAKKNGKKVILNPAPAQALPKELLRNVDYITPNRSELEAITGIDLSELPFEAAVDELLRMGIPYAIVTLGSEGVAWKQQGGLLSATPAHSVPVVDTTGAGDAFNAGLAYYLALGHDIDSSVRFAVKVSALAVTKFGAQDGMPTLKEVEDFTG